LLKNINIQMFKNQDRSRTWNTIYFYRWQRCFH